MLLGKVGIWQALEEVHFGGVDVCFDQFSQVILSFGLVYDHEMTIGW